MHGRISRRRAIIYIIIAVILIALFGCAVYLIDKHGRSEDKLGDSGDWDDEDENNTYLLLNDVEYISNDNIDTYMIAGTDAGGIDQGKGMNGELADFILALVIDNTTEKYAFYQIDRNSMTDVDLIDENGGYSGVAVEQICTAHWYGMDEEERNENLSNALICLLGGLDIEKYYVMSMEDIGTLNNAIGGVTVTIDTDMTSLDPEFEEGAMVHLTDEQAEKYLRARMTVGDGTNAARMRRQKQYLEKAYSMVMGQLRENPEYINDIYNGIKNIFQTNSNGSDLSKISKQIIEYENQGIITFDGRTEVNDTIGEGIEHEEFYVDESSILSSLKKVMNIRVDDTVYEDEDTIGADED